MTELDKELSNLFPVVAPPPDVIESDLLNPPERLFVDSGASGSMAGPCDPDGLVREGRGLDLAPAPADSNEVVRNDISGLP